MRRLLRATIPALLLLAGCGAGGSGAGSGRDLRLALDAEPAGRHAGIYLATARGYDRAAGVTLRIGGEPSDVRLVPRARLDRERDVAVMAILQDELFLTADRVILDEREDDVRAAVEALQRGYEETVVDPESAVATMLAADPELDPARLARELDEAAPRFKAGARDVGALNPGKLPPGTAEPSFVRPTDR